MSADVLEQQVVSAPERQPKRGRFIVNVTANAICFGLNVLIGIWFTPYLIHHLGIAAYGLIPLATTVTSYLGLVTLALNGAVGRFLIIALERHEHTEANRIFNTALTGNTVLVLALLAPTLWLAFHARLFFAVPPGYEQQFSWLFVCTVLMFLLTELNSSFSLASYCRNRFDLSNLVNILSNIARVGAVVLLFTLFTPAVWHVGMGLLLSAVFGIIGSIIIWRHLTPMLHIRPHLFSWMTLRQLIDTGGWLVVTQVGTLLFLGIDLLVVNKMFGSAMCGCYATVMQWSTLLRSIASVIAAVFAPTMLALYANHDNAGLEHYSRQSVKIMGLALSLPIGIICGLSRPLLAVWLGPSFALLAPLMLLMTIHLSINLSFTPLPNIFMASNKVRLPGMVQVALGLLNLLLAIMLAGPLHWGMYGVAAAGAIVLTVKNLLFTPFYSAHLLNINFFTFTGVVLPITAMTLAITLLGWCCSSMAHIVNWHALILASAGMSLVWACLTYCFFLSAGERSIVKSLFIRSVKVRGS